MLRKILARIPAKSGATYLIHRRTIFVTTKRAASQEASDPTKQGPELPWDRFRIVRAEVKGDKRIVGTLKTAVTGKSSQEQAAVPATAEQMTEGWIKLTPKSPLDPGEYAVAELLGKQGMNSYVWDFGVHSGAPANLAVIRPDPSELKPSPVPKN
jgi:hypothetical protein